jgi:hypothetical protein
LKREFARKLEEDSAFASDPNARLEYFLRRHRSWDERYMLYPILRMESGELFCADSIPSEGA